MLILDVGKVCSDAVMSNILPIIKRILYLIHILGPILCIISIIITVIQIIFKPDEAKYKKKIINSLLALTILFFIPTVVDVAMGLLGEKTLVSDCWNNVDINKKLDLTSFIPIDNNKRSNFFTDPDKYEKGKPNPTGNLNFQGEYIKVGIIGNSYSYYNAIGSMLSQLAAKKGKKMVVVFMGHGYYDLAEISRKSLWSEAWNNVTGATSCSKTGKIDSLLNNDYFSMNRAGKFDVIFLQNNARTTSTTNADKKMMSHVSNKVDAKNKIIFNATYSGGQSRANSHAQTCSRYGCGVMNNGVMFSKYPNWRNTLKMNDSSSHQSGQGAYMYAVAMYARIFGIADLAKSESDSNFIPLYNSNNGDIREFVTSCHGSIHFDGSKTKRSVTMRTAKKIQAHVANNYNKYVMFR